MATHAIAQRGVLARAHVLHLQSRAHALAAGLVVAPQRGHARALQDVQHRLVAADGLLVVLRAPVRREHARQRDLRAAAAGGDAGEVQHPAPCELRGGLPRIAVEAPVRGAGRFAHHQHQQARPAHGGRRRLHGILADRQLRARAAGRFFADHLRQRYQHVGRRHQVAHFALVAQERGQGLGHRQHAQHGGADHARQQGDAQGQRALPRAFAQPHTPDHRQCGQRGEKRHQCVDAGQFAGLAPVGVQHVAHHVGVDIDAVGRHVVAGQRGRHHQQRQHHAGGTAPHQQRQPHAIGGGDQQEQRQRPLPLRQRLRCGRPPEHAIGEQAEVQACADDQRLGAHPRTRQEQGTHALPRADERRVVQGGGAHARDSVGTDPLRPKQASTAHATPQQTARLATSCERKCAPRSCCASPNTMPASRPMPRPA